jgi:rhodanese-related sulfurtransferase
MNNVRSSRLYGLFLVAPIAVAALACGSAGQPDSEDVRSPQASVDGTLPIPELRINDAGAVLVTQEEIVRLIDAGAAPLILDVRRPDEFAAGHVPGAVLIPHTELAERLAEIDAAREAGVIVYCESGRRAGMAEEFLVGQGFSNVQHLEGDMRAWRRANLPIEGRQ